MLMWAFIFLAIAIVAAIVGYSGAFSVAAGVSIASGIAKIIFFIFIILAIIAFLAMLFRKNR